MLIVYLPILWIIPWLGSCWTWGGGYEQTTQTVYVCEQQDKTVQEFIKQEEIRANVSAAITSSVE